MKICSKCVLPDTFPGISFDDQGVCNHCQRFESTSVDESVKIEYQNGLVKLLEASSGPIQVLVAYSGGKDSTYTLYLLKKKYGARVKAFVFDNGFISDEAMRNIRRVCETLEVQYEVFRLPTATVHEAFRYGADNPDMFPRKTMERASAVCTICSGFFKTMGIRYALENWIPFIGYGWSPGQAPIQSAIQKLSPTFVKMSQHSSIASTTTALGGRDASSLFLQEIHYKIPKTFWPTNIHPLAFEAYDEEDIKTQIRKLGWVDPKDVDTNSTNCTANAFANQIHINHYGYHPYVLEVANMIRQKVMTREEGMEKIYSPQNQDLVEKTRLVLES